MNAERFEQVFDEQMKICADVLLSKSKEYAIKNEDRLQHFKRTAGFLKTTPEDALVGMLSKHLISVVDMCRDTETTYPLEQWTEKLTDTINYLLLLKGIVVEKDEARKAQAVKTTESEAEIPVRTRRTVNGQD